MTTEGLGKRFAELLECAPDAMVIVDRAGRIRLVNGQLERLFGYARAELIGQPVERLVPDRFRTAHVGHRTGYAAEPRVRSMAAGTDLLARRKDGSEVPVEISLSPVPDGDETLVIAAVRDITEQRRLKAELQRQNVELAEQYRRAEEASQLKSRFLSNMSHELRTPLNAVIGFAELLHDGKVGPVTGEQREFLGDILASSRHLLRLIDDVLDLVRLESGRLELRPVPVDPARLLAEVCHALQALAAAKRIALDTAVDPALAGVVADEARLRQVAYNYLSNAIKFTPEGGRVTVRMRAEGSESVRIEVEDTGIGIGADELARIFVEFQQLDDGTAKRYAGAGLGLALTRRIVEALGGRVGADSTPGRGSVFYAVLPRVPSRAPIFPP